MTGFLCCFLQGCNSPLLRLGIVLPSFVNALPTFSKASLILFHFLRFDLSILSNRYFPCPNDLPASLRPMALIKGGAVTS
jgi:hypothetical protein